MRLCTGLGLTALVTTIAAQGYVQLDFEKRQALSASPYDRRLARRQNLVTPIDASLYQNTNRLEYIINVTVGTPAQTLGVTFDTGSSDLWIPNRQFCTQAKCDFGYFDQSQSTTYNILEEGGFNITYAGPGDSDAGDWSTDSIAIDGSTAITDQIIGVASAGADQHGVIGFGFDTNEAKPNPSGSGIYKTVLDNMVSQGIINRKAYSLYLNSLNETYGSVIIGGVDSTKYTGELTALPLQASPGSDEIREFFVTLTRVAFTDAVGATTVLSPDGYARSVLLDAGTSDTLLDPGIVGSLAVGLGAVDIGNAYYTVPCSYADTNASISYTFGGDGGPTVIVPVSELVGNQDGNECDLGIAPPIGGTCILGDTFLRSAYVVLDLDSKVAAIAQAVDGRAGTSSIVAIPSGTEIPNASSTATAVGAQLTGAAATSTPSVPTASFTGHLSSIIAGTPTFNLGASITQGATSSTSNLAPIVTGKSHLAFIGAGVVAGVLAW